MSSFKQFFIEFKDINGKQVHSHSTLVDDETKEKIQLVQNSVTPYKNGLTFLVGYLALEGVNRVPQLMKHNFYKRVGIVLGSAFVVRMTVEPVFWWVSGNSQLQNIMTGHPVFEAKRDVPELDKMFFFLDDDNNYQPSLLHHGITGLRKNFVIYTNKAN